MDEKLKQKIKRNLNIRGCIKLFKLPLRILELLFQLEEEHHELKETLFAFKSEYFLDRLAEKKHDPQKKIKVGFIVYLPWTWDKQSPLYEMMVSSSDFDPFLILVPHYDDAKKSVSEYGDEKKFFERFGRGDNIIYAYKEGKILNLSQFKFDYVFYQSPYPASFPEELRDSQVVEYAKTCYIPYAFWGNISDFSCGFNIDFYRNLYLGFMESKEHAKHLQDKLPARNHIVFRGYPILENVEIHEMQGRVKRILWTPRWSYKSHNEVEGGSHFFEYKDSFLSLQKEIENISLMIRPHPQAFNEFVSEGMMTWDDVKHFKGLLDLNKIVLDTNKEIADTIKNTDVLLTDASSIIVPCFLTGIPIIFCNYPAMSRLKLSIWFSRIVGCLYIANDWNDVRKYLRELVAGNDYLYEKRQEVASALRHENAGATKRILDTLRQDYAGMTQHSLTD